jgi:predicted RNA-binding Zn-ribbon protein involved in translation (DUF1610 family)
MTMAETPELSDKSSTAGVAVPARITLFGFDDVPADVRIEARSVGWRTRRTAIALAGGMIAAPLAALVPPHAPWALGALGISLLTARRRWTEEHTLHFLDGACPRCGESITISRATRLRHPHAISCPSCHYELALSVDL